MKSDGPMADILDTPQRVITTWLQEFGYRCEGVPGRDVILAVAGERGLTRWARELDAHGKRLADRAGSAPKAQFDSRRMTGRAVVVPRDAAGLERPSNYGKGPTRY